MLRNVDLGCVLFSRNDDEISRLMCLDIFYRCIGYRGILFKFLTERQLALGTNLFVKMLKNAVIIWKNCIFFENFCSGKKRKKNVKHT